MRLSFGLLGVKSSVKKTQFDNIYNILLLNVLKCGKIVSNFDEPTRLKVGLIIVTPNCLNLVWPTIKL
jgi:hypothetical protein